MPNAQPRQSPFQGRGVPPLSMQQQVPPPSQQSQTGTAMPFSVPQPATSTTAAARPSSSLPTAQTTQSRFVPQHLVAGQQVAQTPGSPAYTQQPFQNAPEPGVGALAPPRLLRRTDEGIPHYASRHVTFSFVPSLQIDETDEEATRTTEELPDPTQLSGPPMGTLFPSQDAQPRVVTSDLMHEWTKMVDQNDVDGQNALERRLQQHLGKSEGRKDIAPWHELIRNQLGGSLPEVYDSKLKHAVALKKKASGRRGPVSNSVYCLVRDYAPGPLEAPAC